VTTAAGDVLIAFALPLPLIALVALGVVLVVCLVGRRSLVNRRAAEWAVGAGVLLCAAVLCYSAGVWTGGFFDTAAASARCPAGPLAQPALRQSLLPLRNACHYADNATADRVPAVINPLLGAALAGALGCLVMAVATARRGARRTPTSTS
jgi:hypothetical protein